MSAENVAAVRRFVPVRMLGESIAIATDDAWIRDYGPIFVKRDSDGAWAPHWYATVEASTGFEPYRRRPVELSPAQARLVDECRPYYEKLYALRFRA